VNNKDDRLKLLCKPDCLFYSCVFTCTLIIALIFIILFFEFKSIHPNVIIYPTFKYKPVQKVFMANNTPVVTLNDSTMLHLSFDP